MNGQSDVGGPLERMVLVAGWVPRNWMTFALLPPAKERRGRGGMRYPIQGPRDSIHSLAALYIRAILFAAFHLIASPLSPWHKFEIPGKK